MSTPPSPLIPDPSITGYAARHAVRLDAPEGVRPIRVVHPLDGILQPVPADQLRRVGQRLWTRWQQRHPDRAHDVLLGLDAGGILPTAAVALASGSPYRLAWKLDLDLPAKHAFREPHARRQDVFVYGDLRGQRVLIVDDEITTGGTIANLTSVLRAVGASVVGVLCLVEDTTGHGRARLETRGIPLCALTRL